MTKVTIQEETNKNDHGTTTTPAPAPSQRPSVRLSAALLEKLDSIRDINGATDEALRRVSTRQNPIRRSSKLATLTGLERAVSLLHMVPSDSENDDDDIINHDNIIIDDATALAAASLTPEELRRISSKILPVPELRQVTLFEDKDVASFYTSSAAAKSSVDLGTKRFFAKMKDFAPKNTAFDPTAERRATLIISLGSQNTELARLDAVLQWITAHYDDVTIMPADYIYRLTLQLRFGSLSMDDQQAQQAAIEAEHEYRSMCTTILAPYTQWCRFHWRTMSSVVQEYPNEYAASFGQMKQVYETNRTFRHSVQDFSAQYIARIESSSKGMSNCADIVQDAAIVSLQYLLEECAIFNVLCEKEGPTTLLYAGTIDTVKDLCEGTFHGVPEAIGRNLRFVTIDIGKRGQFFSSGERKVLKVGDLTVGNVASRPAYSSNVVSHLTNEQWQVILKAGKSRPMRSGQTLVSPPSSNKKKKNKKNKKNKGNNNNDSGDNNDNVEDERQELIILQSGRAEELLPRPTHFLSCPDKTKIDNGAGGWQRLSFLGPGSVVAPEAFLDGQTCPVTVQTLEDCNVWRLSRADYQALCAAHPEVALALVQAMANVVSLRARILMYDWQHMGL